MMHGRFRALPWLLSTLTLSLACEPPPLEPRSDSQTNWLQVCEGDGDCPGLSCECGVCTLRCGTDDDCASAPGSDCVAASDAGAEALCGGQAPSGAGLCLPRCEPGECAEQQTCVAGACQPLQPAGVHVSVDTSVTLGTLTGFGAAVVYMEDEVASAGDDPAIESALFSDLGLDVLRLRNRYSEAVDLGASSKVVAAATRSLGRTPLVLLSTWSPPAELKQNGNRFCDGNPVTCTLSTLPSGEFDYAGLARFWRESLDAYVDAGISPDYIGIQNNPDWVPPPGALFEACRFLPSEGTQEVTYAGSTLMARYPGYDRAFEAVDAALADLPQRPRIAAPDISGTHGTESYLERLDVARIDAIAHHLYGLDPENLDVQSFSSLGQLERSTALPLFQSEMQADGFGTALLIHHTLVTEGASMYLQTALAGPLTGPLANPFALAGLEAGQLVLQDPYFAVRHYARFTDPGFHRVATSSGHPNVLSSAWLAPDENELVVVLTNSGTAAQVVGVDLEATDLPLREVVRSVFGASERFAELGADALDHGLTLPPRAVATLRFAR